MKRYIGTKIIHAVPEKHSESGREGYRVRYADGYESWSPQEAFDDAYRSCDGMTFGLAIEALKRGLKVQRAGWNGKGMWLGLVRPKDDHERHQVEYSVFGLAGKVGPCLPWIGMRTADDKFVPWLASQTDMLAEDWMIVI